MVRHNHPGVQVAIGLTAVLDGTSDQARNLRPFQMDWPEPGGIEQTVHRHKCLSGGHAFARKLAANRQAATQPERYEERLPHSINVRQTAL